MEDGRMFVLMFDVCFSKAETRRLNNVSGQV